MAFFKKLFSKDETSKGKIHKGFTEVTIAAVERLSDDAVKVVLETDATNTPFIPGQYLTFIIELNGEELRRSYSICSGKNEPLAVAVKKVKNGKVSTWFNDVAIPGDKLSISNPEGNFIVPESAKNIIAIASGSGITPILSIAKDCEDNGGNLRLFYGNRTLKSTIFASELARLKNTTCTYYYTGESSTELNIGRLNKANFTEIIKSDLDLLKADVYFICGPEEMITDIVSVLELFGVSKEKIKFELFTTPVLLAPKEKPQSGEVFKGKAKVTVLFDGEKESFELAADGPSILDKVSEVGMDVPYSCKGGVCSSCKAKVLKGKVTMTMNYSLTDREVEEGQILTCQSHPASEEIVITYDE